MRNYFDVDAYIAQLHKSESILSCNPVPLPKISDDQNYIFISYSHLDYKQVYADLAIMYQAGVRFWYDHGLTAGQDWDAEAKKIIEDHRCVGVIFFLSENLFLSQSVNKEIDLVRGSEKQPKKNYFCVNLTEYLPSRILRNIMRMDDISLDLAGIDMERISILANAFSDKMTYLCHSEFNYWENLINHITSCFSVVDISERNRGYLIDKTSNTKISIDEDTFIVGRNGRKCHHCVDNDSDVSMVHFSIISCPNESMIMDFGAIKGTYVNEKKIPSMTQIALRDRDVISFGNQRYEFRLI